MGNQSKNMIFGRHPVLDAIKTGTPIDKLLLQQGVRGDFEREIRYLSKQNNIPLQVIPKERLQKYTRGNHQGIVGILSFLDYYKLEDVLPTIYEKSENPLFLLLDGVTDVRNFGAIARSAELCGVHAIVIPQKGSAQVTADAIKTSAGALTNMVVCREKTISGAIDFLVMNGISIHVSSLGASQQLHELNLTEPTAIVMGSEGDGVSQPILKKIENHFIIPQLGVTDSFNVSVATGIILYEVMRQRM